MYRYLLTTGNGIRFRGDIIEILWDFSKPSNHALCSRNLIGSERYNAGG